MMTRAHVVRLLVVGLVLLAFVLVPVQMARAGTPTPNDVEAVARTLYCPLCVGRRLDSCEIPLCQDMKKEIARQLAEGRTPEQIRAYFVQQYGPVVLGEPPRKGVNWLAWVIPIIALLAAVTYAGIKVRQWSQSEPVPAAATDVPSSPAPSPDDEYLAQVERELSQLE